MKRILSLVLAVMLSVCMPVFAGQEADRTKMSKDHQKAYDAAFALYGTSGDVTHFLDRKSTRLNSSHQIISYAVFCLKKKKKKSTFPYHNITVSYKTATNL